jgi:hypothetical protein
MVGVFEKSINSLDLKRNLIKSNFEQKLKFQKFKQTLVSCAKKVLKGASKP